MKKFLVLAILLGGLLSPIKVKAQLLAASNRGSQAGYYFKGHSVADVLVAPYDNGAARKSISVAKDPDYDNQVVYLYHPATGRFLYTDGDWGTLAVVRYEGFGMPLNIVSSAGSDIQYGNEANQNKVNGTYGLYTESFDQGHYLGKDCTWQLGGGWWQYSDQNNEAIQNLRIYIDRGGEENKKNLDWHNDYTDEWDGTLRCLKTQALLDCVFNWGFEEVTGANNDSKVYRLYFYASNEKYTTKNEAVNYPLHKHYIKVENIDVLGDRLGCNMLTSAWRNANGMPNDDETAPAGAEYYWQIVTRGDIKAKFEEDFKDPYSVNAISGNANYNLDNPDFSRPLTKTVNAGNTGFTAYWESDNADFYNFGNLGTDNAAWGRYSSMQPEKDGYITQTFKSYKFGLYRLDCQGFTTGDAMATMSIGSNDSSIKIGDAVVFENLSSIEAMDGIDALLTAERAEIAANGGNERMARSRAVGKYFYADENEEKYMKYIYFYVPEGSEKSDITINLSFTGIDGDFNANYAALDNVRLTYMGDAPYVLDEDFEQNDLNELAKSNSSWIPVYMKRQFDVNAWNALVCPIPLTYGQLKSAFGDDMKLSEIQGLDADNPYVIKFRNVFEDGQTYEDGAEGVLPGHFYLVKPSKVDYTTSIVKTSGANNFQTVEGDDVKLVFVGRHNLSGDAKNGQASERLQATRNNSDAYCDFTTATLTSANNSDHNAIELHGSYKQQTISAADRGNCYVFATQPGKTALVHLNKTGGAFPLKAFRFYIKDVENGNKDEVRAKAFSFVVDGVEDADEQAGIFNAVNNGNAIGDGSIYTLAGQKVNGSLSKGIYVKNGKKFLVK